MQIANAPEISSVQRKPVVRMNSGRSTEDESFATDVVDHRLFFESIDLPTQPAHMHVHKIASRNELVIPNFLKQHCARQQLILPTHHVLEQAKFTRQEVDRALTGFGRRLGFEPGYYDYGCYSYPYYDPYSCYTPGY
jgi:hypothetical protein